MAAALVARDGRGDLLRYKRVALAVPRHTGLCTGIDAGNNVVTRTNTSLGVSWGHQAVQYVKEVKRNR